MMISNFSQLLVYESNYKLITIIIMVLVTFLLYLLTSIITKALKLSDIKLKY